MNGTRGALARASAVFSAIVALGLMPIVPAVGRQFEIPGAVPGRAVRLRAAGMALCTAPVLELRGGGGVHLPTVAWSQRQNTLMLKIEVPAGVKCSADNIKVGEQSVAWHEAEIGLDLSLFQKLDEASIKVHSDGGRVVTVTANKAAEEWWDKLTDGPKPHNVKVDWASWKDEDEEDEKPGALPGMDGMPGIGDDGFNFDDMDMDKDLPEEPAPGEEGDAPAAMDEEIDTEARQASGDEGDTMADS